MSTARYAAACGSFAAAVAEGDLVHLGDPAISNAVAAATVRRYGSDDGWMWTAPPGVDITPLRAVTVAAFAAGFVPTRRSVYEPDYEPADVLSSDE